MANGIRTGDPVDSIKDVVRSSVKVPEFDKHLKKAGGHISRNVVQNNKDNSPKTFNDKNTTWKLIIPKSNPTKWQKRDKSFINYIYIYIYIFGNMLCIKFMN